MFWKLVLFEELALAGAPFGPLAGSWQTADAIIEYGTGSPRCFSRSSGLCSSFSRWSRISASPEGTPFALMVARVSARN